MDIKKLAGFLEIDADTLRGWLLVNKQRSKQVRHTEGGLLDGDVVTTNDLDYAMQGVSYRKMARIMISANMKLQDLIHVSEAKVGRKLVDWYLRNLSRTY